MESANPVYCLPSFVSTASAADSFRSRWGSVREGPDLFVAYAAGAKHSVRRRSDGSAFNSSEKRLAQLLLLLARFGEDGVPEVVIPTISQETLAETDRHDSLAG